MQRGNYLCKSSDAVKLAAIHYYVWHGPYDPNAEQFKMTYMKELRLGERLMPTPLITAQVAGCNGHGDGAGVTVRNSRCRRRAL